MGQQLCSPQADEEGPTHAAYAPNPSSSPPSSSPFHVINSNLPSCLLPSSQARCLSYHTIAYTINIRIKRELSFKFVLMSCRAVNCMTQTSGG